MNKNIFGILTIAMISLIVILSSNLVMGAQPTVDLGSADNFVILSEAQITDATPAASAITGNIGVHPAAGTFIEDVSCSTVTGTVYDNNAGYTGGFDSDVTCLLTDSTLLGNAIGDMDIARLDAQGRISNDVLADTNELDTGILSATTVTFKPGLHIWSTAVSITGSITLDCNGNSNGILIFQVAQTLDLASGAQIFLTNGCQADNIFWVVSGQTTLGTNSVFNGNILDETGIVIQTGATLNGRALAQTAVTLDDNAVTIPSAVTPFLSIITLSTSSNLTSINLTIGETNQLNASSTDQFGNSILVVVNYTSSNNSVATVNASGFVTAISIGNAIITSKNGTVNDTVTINVIETPIPETPSSGSGGGGGGGRICTTKWECGDWNSCVGGTQTRSCSYPLSWCAPKTDKPIQTQECNTQVTGPTAPVGNSEEPQVNTPTGDGITGAIINETKKVPIVGIVLVILIIAGIITTLIILRRRK